MDEIIIICAAIIHSIVKNLTTRLICNIRHFQDASSVTAGSHHLSPWALLGRTFLKGNNIKYQPGNISKPPNYYFPFAVHELPLHALPCSQWGESFNISHLFQQQMTFDPLIIFKLPIFTVKVCSVFVRDLSHMRQDSSTFSPLESMVHSAK